MSGNVSTAAWWAAWLPRALDAVTQGRCPEHGTPLGHLGWCPACMTWWSPEFARTVAQIRSDHRACRGMSRS